MNNFTKITKIALRLPKGYFQAKRNIKSGDLDKSNVLLKKTAKACLDSMNKEIEIINLNENLDLDGSLIISNHQDDLDILVLFQAFKENVRFVAKKELFNLPLFRTYIKMSRSYSLDRSNARQSVKLFKDVVEDINNGANVVVFPEGTRSKCGMMSDFNTGLFNIFRRIKKPIIPVYVDGGYDNSRKDIKVIIGKPINVSELSVTGTELSQLVFDDICELKNKYALNKEKYNFVGLGDSITFGESCDGSYQEGYYGKVIARLKKEALLESSYNLSVPGATINDLVQLIDDNDYEKRLASVLENNGKSLSDVNVAQDVDVKKAIKNADFIILSIGANDIINSLNHFKITKEEIFEVFEKMYNDTVQLIEKINGINENVKIIYIGQYFPFPHSKALIKYNLLNTLDLYANKLAIKFNNLDKIIISEDVLKNKDTFLPNKRNFHLSDEGYQYIADRVIKDIQKDLKEKNGVK